MNELLQQMDIDSLIFWKRLFFLVKSLIGAYANEKGVDPWMQFFKSNTKIYSNGFGKNESKTIKYM